MLRRTPFRSKMPPPRPAKQWAGDALPGPRATVQAAANDLGIVAPIAKREPVRNEAYRRYVATFPCFGCGIAGFSQAAHPNHGRGLGQKADDTDCFPLCAPRFGLIGCHAQFDQLIDISRAERRELELKYTARMQAQARTDGRKEFA